MLPPPHPVVRRVLIAPAVVAGFVAIALTLPLVVPVAAFLSRYVPGRWRILRIVWFLFLYLAIQTVSLVVLFGFWLGSGLGWRIRSSFWQEAHYGLLAWMLRRIVASAKSTFKIELVREGDPPSTARAGRRRPVLVLSRHAGPGDSLLLMDAIANRVGRRPRIVLKDFLQWDPAIDVMLNRVPSAFVPSTGGSDAVLEAIRRMSSTMGPDDAFVIFPEGGNYSVRRHLRSIEKLREIGRPDLAERAEALSNTLPPRSTGVNIALAAAPRGTDVFFVGHAGLEVFETMGDIWRGMPIATEVNVRVWHFPAETLPSPDRRESWLFDVWSEIDAWIGERLARTAEPFDDPDAY